MAALGGRRGKDPQGPPGGGRKSAARIVGHRNAWRARFLTRFFGGAVAVPAGSSVKLVFDRWAALDRFRPADREGPSYRGAPPSRSTTAATTRRVSASKAIGHASSHRAKLFAAASSSGAELPSSNWGEGGRSTSSLPVDSNRFCAPTAAPGAAPFGELSFFPGIFEPLTGLQIRHRGFDSHRRLSDFSFLLPRGRLRSSPARPVVGGYPRPRFQTTPSPPSCPRVTSRRIVRAARVCRSIPRHGRRYR
jgi:hypothetical protein